MRSHGERRCSILGPTQSRISPSVLSIRRQEIFLLDRGKKSRSGVEDLGFGRRFRVSGKTCLGFGILGLGRGFRGLGRTCQSPRSRSAERSPSSFRPSRLPDIARSLSRPGIRPFIRQVKPSILHRSLLFAHFVCHILHEACRVPGLGLLFDRRGLLFFTEAFYSPISFARYCTKPVASRMPPCQRGLLFVIEAFYSP